MDYYFSGTRIYKPAGKYVGECNGCVLWSQARDRYETDHWIDFNKEGGKVKIFVDSGAYAMMTRGIKVDIDEYINYINSISEYITIFACLDVIGSQEETINNYKYMYSRVKEPDKMLFVHHVGEDLHLLEDIVKEYDIKYVGLGGVANIKNINIRRHFINDTFKVLEPLNVKTHLFGVSDPVVVREVPCTSIDSASHIMMGAMGTIAIPVVNKKKFITVHHSELDSVSDLGIDELFAECGYTREDIINSRDARVHFNVFIRNKFIEWYEYTGDTSYLNKGSKMKLW